jgi:hypothetical protein
MRGVDSGLMLSLLAAKEFIVPGAASIVSGSSWEDDCGLGVPRLLLACQLDCAEPWSRLCWAFRFCPRLVVSDSNWVRFGPHVSSTLLHLSHFSCVFPSHIRSDGPHCSQSDLKMMNQLVGAQQRKRGERGRGEGMVGAEPWRPTAEKGTPYFLFCTATWVALFACFRAHLSWLHHLDLKRTRQRGSAGMRVTMYKASG